MAMSHHEQDHQVPAMPRNIGTDYSYKHRLVWKNMIAFIILHLFALWGLIKILTGEIGIKTFIWTIFLIYLAAESVTTGPHRLFTHTIYKAFLLALHTLAGQNSMYTWCRDHRYSDTDADPHNSKRGFFFCHMGWLMHKKHPYVFELGRTIDMNDLQGDWMVMFQKKYYFPLYLLFAIFIPIYVPVPVYFFGEQWRDSVLVCYFLRYAYSLHITWHVNSFAHLYGTRPYDKTLQPVESWFVSVFTFGEGWHNYHHAYPWDYRAAELSNFINHSATIIQFLEKIGLAYDLKTVSPEMVASRILRTGDGSHYKLGDEGTRAVRCGDGVGTATPAQPHLHLHAQTARGQTQTLKPSIFS